MATLGLGVVGGGYYGWNQRQQRLAAEQQQRLAEARRLFEERAAEESANIKDSILGSLAHYETSNDQQEINQKINWLINKIEEQKAEIEQTKILNQAFVDVEQDLQAIEERQRLTEQQKKEAEAFFKQQVQERIDEYYKKISSLWDNLQKNSGNEDAQRYIYQKFSNLMESFRQDKLVQTDLKQQETLLQKAKQARGAIYPKEGVPVFFPQLPSSSSSSSSSSQPYMSQPYQAPIEQRSIPIITIQNMYGSPLEIGAKFKNGITKKSYPIDNNKFLTLYTNVNVSEWDQNQFQPVDVKQEGSATDLLLTRRTSVHNI